MKKQAILFLILCCFFSCGNEPVKNTSVSKAKLEKQEVERSYTGQPLNRFDEEIQKFELDDAKRTVLENEVLFTGSSSIRMWSTLAEDFEPIPVLNRGFGGSTLPEIIHYADRIIFPYQPKLIVLYCGENDIADGASAEQVFASYKKLDKLIEEQLPETQMIYIAMKPSVARASLWAQYQTGDRLIKNFIDQKDKRYFIDCSPEMLNEKGEPDAAIFIQDMLHMNASGYAGWKKLIRPKVEEIYNKLD